MIPKIIHFCWLSGDPFPKDIALCLESWKKHLQDYELWLWGKTPEDNLGLKIVERSFDLDSAVWCKQAFEAKKYAFAADYIRLYALYYKGGVYLDSDVVVYKSFNDLLHLPYFIGEDRTHCFEPAIIGCEPGTPWIKYVLDRYKNIPFICHEGNYNMRGLPLIFNDRLKNKYQFYRQKEKNYKYEDNVIRIFPYNHFNSRDYLGSKKYSESYCSHTYQGSWLKKNHNTRIIRDAKKIIPRQLLNYFYRFYYLTIGKLSLKENSIKYM